MCLRSSWAVGWRNSFPRGQTRELKCLHLDNPDLKSHRFGLTNPHDFGVSGWVHFLKNSFFLLTPEAYNIPPAGGEAR